VTKENVAVGLDDRRERIDVEVKRTSGRNGRGEVPSSFFETYSAMAKTVRDALYSTEFDSDLDPSGVAAGTAGARPETTGVNAETIGVDSLVGTLSAEDRAPVVQPVRGSEPTDVESDVPEDDEND
jgi:hypothetical protein